MLYTPAPDVEEEMVRILQALSLDYIDPARVRIIRSEGTKSRRVLARCHALPKALQTGLGLPASYVIELVMENYMRLPEPEKTKTLIHELLHIPRAFGGGFRNHDYVCSRRVNEFYERYQRLQSLTAEGKAIETPAGLQATSY